MFSKSSLRVAAAVVACAFTFSLASHAEVSAGSKSARVLITQKIDETKLVTLVGNTRPRARNAKNDRGAVAADVQMPTMQLLLKRSPEQEAALAKLMEQLHTPGNSNYHQWLTPVQFAESFGVSQTDVQTVKNWLTSQGFKVTGATGTGLQIEFEGTVGQVNAAFHTEIHNVAYTDGNTYFANVRDPQIPAALTAAVVGPVSLNNFPAHNYSMKRGPVQVDPTTHDVVKVGTVVPGTENNAQPDYTFSGCGGTCYSLVPGDIQTIYNIAPLLAAGYTGKGQTIGFLEDTPVYSAADLTTYQSTFGLSSYGGTFVNNNPAKPASGGMTCTAPTDNSDDIEAELDLEMGIAVAPGATIVDENCKAIGRAGSSGSTIFGGLVAFENLENSATYPTVISMSYGLCEAVTGATYNASFNTAFTQGAAEGISIFTSSGDSLGGGCTDEYTNGEYYNPIGLGITGWGESPAVTSVGGTDFSDTYSGTNSTYWNSTNGTYYNSAKSYIPEIPWNFSCANSLIETVNGYSGVGYCNSGISDYPNGLLDVIGGAGGFSTCYTGTTYDNTGLVSSACAGIAQPSYQAGLLGMPTSTPPYGSQTASGTITRTIPDVSMFASNGTWGHFVTICYSHTADGGVACTGAPSTWVGIGGTSAAAPMMASVQALVDQYVAGTTNGVGAKQGNANYVLYNLAKQEYATATTAGACNSSLGNGIGSSCVFNDVTLSDIYYDCVADGGVDYNCTIPSGDTYGISTTGGANAFSTGVGYDLATGIGSVNAYNLATNWRNAFPTTTSLSVGSATDSGNGNDVLTATVSAATGDNTNSGGTNVVISGTVNFLDGATQIGSCTLTAATGSATCSYTATGSQFNPGSNSITAVYVGCNAYPGSTSSAKTITETDATSTSVSASPSSITTAQTTVFTATVTDTTAGANVPTGSVTFTEGSTTGTQVGSCTLSNGTCSSAAVSGATLGVGTDTVYANYAGVANNYAASSGSTSVVVSTAGPANGYITFSSVSHNFGQVQVGTAATDYTLKVTNSGTAAYPFSLSFTPANGFTSANNCPASIAAGASCELAFYFTPTTTGAVSATWSLTPESGFGYTPSNGGTLQGSGTSQGGVSATTAGHNFGTVAVGQTSSTYGVELSNSTSSAETLSLGTVSAPFHVVTNCETTLPAGSSCELEFTFTPTTTSTVQQVYSLSGTPAAITSGGAALPNGGITLTGN